MNEPPQLHCFAGDGDGSRGASDPPAGPFEEALELVATSTGLRTRNLNVCGRRTSMRLDPLMWTALDQIAEAEERSVNEIVSVIDVRRDRNVPLTTVVRAFLLDYFRRRATGPDADGMDT